MKRIIAIALAMLTARADVSLGMLDDFQAGTTADWSVGVANVPTVEATGGPGGDGDRFLLLSSTGGGGPLSKLVVRNKVGWKGQYSAQGIGAIALAANNLGATELNLRVAFGNQEAPSGTWFASANAVVLAPGSGWTPIVLPIGPGDMVSVQGSDDYTAVLNSVAEVRLLSSAAPGFRGDAINAQLGLDNIAAVVPEPAEYAGLAGVCLLGFAWTRRRKA